MNEYKAKIDDFQERLNNNDKHQHEEDINEIELLQIELEDTKKNYRNAFSEMKLCKVQLQDMMELKKRTLNSLVSAYEELTKN